jgi:NADPH-dependent 2,4-dienoyl-CoA reductase/sulfur reductase-like enzyme/rhodanese-related sulfurtransferase
MTKLVIVGGVAGGASAAARARRLDENLQITVFERGKYISYANCGLPYHLSGTIPGRDSLLLMTPELFDERFNVKIHTSHLVTAVNPHEHTVSVKNLATGEEFTESYDKLILSPGSSPLIPPIPGVDDRDVHVLWTIPDMDSIKGRIKPGVRAVVVGGGFIGVEVAENLTEAGVKTTMVEMQTTILPPLDHEMTSPIEKALVNGGVSLRTATSVTSFVRKPSGLEVTLSSGETLKTDFVVMSVGVKPNSDLARGTDIKVTDRGYFVVNERMETTVPDIYAVGDAVQVLDPVTGNKVSIPLAGPANKQGRIAAENALGGSSVYKGTIGTSILKIFDLAAGSTGANERTLKAAGIDYRKLYINPVNHAAYYPGGSKMAIKVLFSPEGAIFGAQVIGYEGVDKRLDVFATAIRHGLTVHHLEELELAYAPPFGSAKEAINFAGFVAVNMINGLTDPVNPDEIPKDCFLLDVREEEETILGEIEGSTLIPLGELRRRLNELPKDRLIVIYCAVGIRGYAAERILKQKGYRARNLSGGFSTWKMYQDIGQFSEATDLLAKCRSTGNELVSTAEEKGIFNA